MLGWGPTCGAWGAALTPDINKLWLKLQNIMIFKPFMIQYHSELPTFVNAKRHPKPWLTPKDFPGRELIRRPGKKVLMNGRLFRPIMTDIIELWVAAIILLMIFNLLQLSQSENPNWKESQGRSGRSITGPLPSLDGIVICCRNAATRLQAEPKPKPKPEPKPEPEEMSVSDFFARLDSFKIVSTDFYPNKNDFFFLRAKLWRESLTANSCSEKCWLN